MAWVAVNYNGNECVFDTKPERYNNLFWVIEWGDDVYLPKGSIKKLIGRELTWEDEPVELKEDAQEMIAISMKDYRRFLSYAI